MLEPAPVTLEQLRAVQSVMPLIERSKDLSWLYHHEREVPRDEAGGRRH